MVKILHLYPSDMTFIEEEKKVTENRIKLSDAIQPTVEEGKAIFRERPIRLIKFWKKRRNLGIYLDGTLKLFTLEGTTTFHSEFGTLDEWNKYIAGRMEKLKNKQKPMELWQLIIIIAMLAAMIVLQLKSMGILNV